MQIQSFKVENYRSLKDVNIGNLSSMVIFYGHNDSGKSNILSFLDIIFRSKYIRELTTTSTETLEQIRPTGFWRGEIDDFTNNFYLNNSEPITFSVVVKFDRKEILAIPGLPKRFNEILPLNKNTDVLKINGQIVQKTSDKAEISLLDAEFNQMKFYDTNLNPEPHRYLPGYSDPLISQAEKRDIFDKVMSRLDNVFLMVPTNRFLSTEHEQPRTNETIQLSPNTIKNWLFHNTHNRDKEKIVRKILEQFNSDPFNHGRISTIRQGENDIEAYVEDKNELKLPVGRRGSSVQQILIILSYINQSNSSIIGIEELEINLSPKTQSLIFDNLLRLVNIKDGYVKQIFLTSHSPHIAKRNEAARRGVWMENGETKVKKPSEADIESFFKY
jgi:AAA15 family ATPase/GTPase